MKCSTIGCKNEATRRMSWRDRNDLNVPRIVDPVCDECLTDYQRRPALKAQDEGPVN